MDVRSQAKRARLSGVLGFLLLPGVIVLFYVWPSFIDSSGVQATGHITEKIERIRIPFDSWFRSFQIMGAFRVPGNPIEHHAVCDVDQATYDSLHVGNPVILHYWPALLSQPFIPATHLAPCTALANFTSNPVLYRTLQLVIGSLLGILFLVLVLRLRIALWLLVPWFYLFLVGAVVPRAEQAPVTANSALARIRNITAITTIMENSNASGGTHVQFGPIKLDHPFQIVELEFTPSGMADSVVGIDAIDMDSIPDLHKNQTLAIDYDRSNPRIARLRSGTRNFPEQARHQVLLQFGALAAVFLGILFIGRILRYVFASKRRRQRQEDNHAQ